MPDPDGGEMTIEHFELFDELDRDYLLELSRLQVELLALQTDTIEHGGRILVIFEGRDAAGKGGAILRFAQHLRPRHRRIVALAKPTDRERGQWYFQRYVQLLPSPGEMVFYDRSWYNRAVVEPVMGFCTPDEYELFMRQVVPFETMLVEDGVMLFKLWFSIDRTEQERRLDDRRVNPLKRWKLSSVDTLAQQKWEQYTRHKEQMFARTSSERAPWFVILGNDKKTARLESIRHVLSRVDYRGKGRSGAVMETDPRNVRRVLPGEGESGTLGLDREAP
jgi:polyphosphate kinase 2